MFYVKEKINKKNCIFKVDTGSDVTLIREGLLEFTKWQVSRNKSFNFRYPTGEKVPVKFEVRVSVELGEFSIKFSVYVVDIKDDCLLENDFLWAINFKEFCLIFWNFFSERERELLLFLNYEGLIEFHFLRELFKKETQELNEKQKERFAQFLIEFQNVFSEEIIAGNCNIVEHTIRMKNSNPIKQTLRRILFIYERKSIKLSKK